MENENNENFDSEIEETQPVQLTVDDYRKLEAEKLALEEKNRKLYARLKKEESSDKKPLVETQKDSISNTEFTRLKLKVDSGITDPDALDFIMKNGGEKALENPYIKATIENMILQKNAEKAVISEESGKSEVEKKYTTAQLKDMPSEELEKILPHA